MRTALPNAAFIAFTGTPLIEGEQERTRQVFGEYVSKYNFKQSVDDGATVPLYYENRVPEMELTNEQLNEDFERILEEAELNEAQEEKIKQKFADQYQVITRDGRFRSHRRRYWFPLYGTRTPGQGDGRLNRQSHRRLRCTTRCRNIGNVTVSGWNRN